MTNDEMVDRVQSWIADRSKTVEECLDIATDIHDLCEGWISALKSDLANKESNHGD